jgi:hypothetical protein
MRGNYNERTLLGLWADAMHGSTRLTFLLNLYVMGMAFLLL